MPKKVIEDKEEDITLIDLRDIKPDNLLEIKNVVPKDEAIDLDVKITTAGYDIVEDLELLGDEEDEI